ncbi:phosphatidylserine/phosphatidylglycerophosphate/cardiolipin synthase family protein [Micromonospora sp. C31]|uniref:phospholipase D-like domain-containing protein DpdK n=1 Tax=Micromonospora sp. C31 TaxID=2824876 RepID=UPI001B396385|nr:phospholipase D-like domain-containing protein DpdK [Micromonospora sp. C31]MBQ1076747.1 phosphatidylserine/phosphatidylglycerophosphate/cardiolipin synthase family protein [Micromonospora sp. C31]
MNRVIRKSKAQSASEVLDLLGALFAAELVNPSKCLWLVSPWISDVEVIDNSGGTYPALTRYGRRGIRLAEVLTSLAAKGMRVVIATTSDAHNDTFRRRIEQLIVDIRVSDQVTMIVNGTRGLHTKALTGDDYALVGSMNITYNGIHLNEEQVELRCDPTYVAHARMDAFDRFGGVL